MAFIKTDDLRLDSVLKVFENSKLYQKLSECENGSKEHNIISLYHMEETVLDHTSQVFEIICKKYKNDSRFFVLGVGALLHDSGKPAARKVNLEKQKVTFCNHENLGVWVTLEFFKLLENNGILLDYYEKRDIINIVNFHDIYRYDFEKNCKRFNEYTLNLLYDFHYADVNGRISDFKEVSLKNEYIKKENKEFSICMQMMIGLPNSGKSTIANDCSYYFILSRDNILLEYGKKRDKGSDYSEIFTNLTNEDQKEIDKRFDLKLKEFVSKKYPILIDKTNTSKKSRNVLKSKVNLKDYKTKAKVLLIPESELKLRNQKRYEETGKFIPDEVFNKFKNAFSIPDLTEFDEIEYIF